MRIGIFLSSKGGSPLQIGLERGLSSLGHHVEPHRRFVAYDLVLILNQCAHVTDYRYPEFPNDARVPIAFIDSAEYGYFRRLPEVIQHYANAFAPGSMDHDTKNRNEQERLQRFLDGRSFPYFLREFSKHLTFPAGYHPIDYPLYLHSECHIAPDRAEYLRRSEDLFVSWGASHPWRWDITRALRACPGRNTILVIEENGTPRMPQRQYFEKTRAAKCSVSFDGYGSGSFRIHEVLVRCLLLQGPLSIHRWKPLIDGEHCIEYQLEHDGERFISTNIADRLRKALADPERSFAIYQAGYEHCHRWYSERATAQYVLDTVHQHDWSKPTQLSL